MTSIMKNMNLILSSLFLFFSALVPASGWAGKWDQTLPLQSTEDKAQAFLKISSLIPSLSDGAVRYAFDPLALLSHQVQIEDLLKENSLFQNLKRNHKDLLEFAIYDEKRSSDGKGQLHESTEKETLWKAWQNNSAQRVKSMGLQNNTELLAEIKKTLASPMLGKSQSISVGLSQILPPQFKKTFFAANLEEKISILTEHLPNEVVSHGFSPAKVGWQDTEISKAVIIDRLQEALSVEQHLSVLMVHDYSTRMNIITPKDYVTKMGLSLEEAKTAQNWFNTNVAKLIPNEVSPREVLLRLKEIPPVVAMFRGFAGNDCSTSCSFPFVNSPNEFTFLVTDAKGGVKGYTQATKVSVDGKDSLYLHTIAGPRISTSDALAIMQTFESKKDSLGFSEIILPLVSKVDALVNFIPVRDAIKQVATDQRVQIEYQDSPLRAQFKSTFEITKSYDDAENNTEGLKIDSKKLNLALNIQSLPSPSLGDINTTIEKNSLVPILLQLAKKKDHNSLMIEALAPHAGVTLADVNRWSNAIRNYTKLPMLQFIESVEANFKENGIVFKEAYFKKNISLIASGLLSSPDLIADRKLTLTVLQTLLEQREFAQTELFLVSNPDFLTDDHLLDSFFRAFYNDVHEANFKPATILISALKKNPHGLFNNPELLKILCKSVKARQTLGDFLRENKSWMDLIPAGLKATLQETIQKKINLRNRFISEFSLAKNDIEFKNTIASFYQEASDQGLSQQNVDDMQKQIYLATVNHLLEIHPTTTISSVFNFLSRNRANDELCDRKLRQMLPVALRIGPSNHVNFYLEVAAKLKGNIKDPSAFDKLIEDSISSRPDRQLLKLTNAKLFPNLNWKGLSKFRCEMIFQ